MATPSARTQELDGSLAVACPRCGAREGASCIARRRDSGLLKAAWPPHKARVEAFREGKR